MEVHNIIFSSFFEISQRVICTDVNTKILWGEKVLKTNYCLEMKHRGRLWLKAIFPKSVMIYEMIHFTIEMFNISTYIQENNLDFSLTQFICKMKNRQTYLSKIYYRHDINPEQFLLCTQQHWKTEVSSIWFEKFSYTMEYTYLVTIKNLHMWKLDGFLFPVFGLESGWRMHF